MPRPTLGTVFGVEATRKSLEEAFLGPRTKPSPKPGDFDYGIDYDGLIVRSIDQ